MGITTFWSTKAPQIIHKNNRNKVENAYTKNETKVSSKANAHNDSGG